MLAAALLAWTALAPAATSTSSVAPAPTVELVTMAPGGAIYALWGHAALRVVERAPRRDTAYNFGSVDVSGLFVGRMLTGKVHAHVVARPYHEMAQVYRDAGRAITRYTLNLEPDEARALAAALAARAAVEEPYVYHHFDDNCATKPADYVDRALGGYPSTVTSTPAGTTLRALALGKVRDRALLYVAADTLMTAVVDRPITAWDTRFLPEALADLFERIEREDGAPLVRSSFVEYRGEGAAPAAEWTWPWVKVYLLLVLPLLFAWIRFPRVGALIWAALAGASGLLVTLAWVLTGYGFLHHNWNLLVLPPTHLAALLVLARPRWWHRAGVWPALRGYAFLHLAVLAGLTGAVAAGVIRQEIDPVLGLAIGPALLLALRPPDRG